MSFFIGLWPIIKSYSIAFILLGCCVGLGLLTASLEGVPVIGPVLVKLERKIMLAAVIAGAIIVAWILGNSMGIKNEADRCKAQFAAAQKAAVTRGNAVRTRAERDAVGGVRDPRDMDQQR